MADIGSSVVTAFVLIMLAFPVGEAVNDVYTFVKVFNKMKGMIANVTMEGKNKFSIQNMEPGTSTKFKTLSGDTYWNISVKTEKGKSKFGEFEFKANRQYGLVAHNNSNGQGLYVLDVTREQKKGKNHIGIEEALLIISSNSNEDINVKGVTENCHLCDLQPLSTCYSKKEVELVVDSRWKYKLELSNRYGGKCSFIYHFQENWHYRITVNQTNATGRLKCVLATEKEASNPYIPIFVMFAIFGGLIILYHVTYCIWSKRTGHLNRLFSQISLVGKKSDNTDVNEEQQPPPPKKKRLRSLDTFRGIAITLMIFVNYKGGGYYFFEHSKWNGLTVADLVFPWFIFIMGTSIQLSQKNLIASGGNKLPVFWKTIIRSFKLFLIGFFLSVNGDLTEKRIPGVLQRFGISYFVVATVNLFCSPRVKEKEEEDPKWIQLFGDVVKYWLQWLIMLSILLIYLTITFLLEVPGCPRGYLGPGGIADHGKYPHCTGGAAGYIDQKFFGNSHIYHHPTCKKIYLTTEAYDPEGLLGSLTSIFLTFLGLQAGRIIVLYKGHSERIVRWMTWGVFWGIVAIGLTGGTKNEGVIPINKNLWSVSFIFATGSLGYILLASLYVVIDVKHIWNGSPFFFAGMNAIFLYFGHEAFGNYFPFNIVIKPPTHASLLSRSAIGTSLWVLISYYLYRKNKFFKV